MELVNAVQEFVSGYFSTCRRGEKTQAAYKIDLTQLQAHIGKATLIQNVRSEVLEQWASDMRSRSYAIASVRRKFATARLFFSYWVRKGVLDRSPLWGIRLDLGRARVLPRSLSPNDVKVLIEEAWRGIDLNQTITSSTRDARFLRIRNLAAIEILFATGMRVGELVAISLKDWKREDMSFLVNGKGGRQRLAFLPDNRSIRAVELYLKHRDAVGKEESALLLNSSGQRMSSQGIARMLDMIAKNAGITSHVTPHMLRHTVATLLLRYGADLRLVQEVLGHASISTTQWYTHISKEHMASALRVRHPSHHLAIACPMV